MNKKIQNAPTSTLRNAVLKPAQSVESRGIPAWASVMLIVVGGAVFVFGLVRLVHFAWFF